MDGCMVCLKEMCFHLLVILHWSKKLNNIFINVFEKQFF